MQETEIINSIIDKPDPRDPFGAKCVGEPALVSVTPVIGNAIYDAVGVRIAELPITPEKVLISKPKLEGYNLGARTLTLGLRDEGMEVIYIGLRKTPEEMVDRAAKATEERAAEL